MPAVLSTMSTLTIQQRVRLAADMLADLTTEDNESTYLGIGRNAAWAANDTLVETPVQSIEYENQVRRDLIAIKKLFLTNTSLVIRRKDWVANTKYDQFSQNIEMYSSTSTINANGQVTLTNTSNVVGVNTTFLLDFANNSLITLPGDGINILSQLREVINVVSNTVITTNLAFSGTFTSNTPQKTVNYAPNYAKNFYVRNSYDQVFVCLDNNSESLSTDMPKIGIGGQLPSDPYIITADSYKWKYLYTMSGGMKQNFLTSDWMPVTQDDNAAIAAVDGRLDFVRIFNGGTGYNNTAATLSAAILNVSGDGTGANLTAQVDANGTIYGINMLNGGSGYTKGNITANVGTTGANANLYMVIGPSGGWASNVALELGATTAMFSITITGTESGTIPTVDSLGNFFKYRQITLIQKPLLANGAAANATNYEMSSSASVSSNIPFAMGDLAYQSSTGLYANATFTANVVWFDPSTNQLHLNNLNGTFAALTSLYGTTSSNASPYGATTAFSLSTPAIKLTSGDLLFMENRASVTRSPSQSENIRIIIQF
jgi:hypothetical protein